MKALVLSGGAGTRLRPFSHSMPKQLVPVANQPVLRHCLANLHQAGIREVGVIVGNTADAIRAELGDGSDLGLSITYLPQDAPSGLAHCVLIAREFLGDDDFVMYLGDNVLVGGIVELTQAFQARRPAAQLVLTKVADPREYGVAELATDGRVARLVEKPQEPVSDLAVTGIYFLTPVIHEAVRAIRPSARGELEITDALQWLVEAGHDVRGEVFGGYWRDAGRIDDLLDCNEAMLDALAPQIRGDVDADSTLVGPVTVEPGARIRRSRLVGPVIVGRDAEVTHSELGPYVSLGSGCVVERAGIERSIVLDGARIRDLRGIHGSVIGRRAELTAGAGLRLVLGDDSALELG